MERFLMLGRQHLYLTSEEAKASAILRPFSKDLDALRRNSGGYGESFLGALGMKHIDSLDYSDYEGATVVHNLNEPVPASWEERHDLVFDGGSLEHVFQFPIALESCMRMVKQGGHFVSITTSNNYNGHGFYQFSAELFFRVFSRENGFSLTLAAFAESRRGGRLYRVDDPAERRHRILFQGKGPMLILLVARRDEIRPLFTGSPAQSDYAQVWQSGGHSGETPKRRWALLRRTLPASFLSCYDRWRIARHSRREALRGIHPVSSVAEAFREAPHPPVEEC
jgi:hypothetical protein